MFFLSLLQGLVSQVNIVFNPANFRSLIPVFIKGLIMASFVAVSSGRKKWSVRKTVCGFAAAVLILPTINITASGVPYSWALTIISILILYLCSRLCGEKKRTRAVSLAAVAVNAEIIIESVIANIYFEMGKVSVDPDYSLLFFTYLSPNKTCRYITDAVLAAVLLAAAFFLIKKDVSLNKRAGAAVALSVFISTVLITLIQFILKKNEMYIYLKTVSLSSARYTVIFSIVCLIGILLLNVTVYVLLTRISRQNKLETEYAIMRQQYAGQSAVIEEVSRRHGLVSRMRHDLSSVLGTVNELIRAGKYDEASAYIEKQTGRLSADVRAVNTNNEYVNSLISYETSRAKDVGVDVSVYTVKEIDFPDDIDLCNLIGNMFDNAIRAAAECDGTGTVRLDVCREKDAYRITMLNSVRAPVLTENPSLTTTKEDKVAHGFGTKIIKEIAEKYYGSTDFYDTPDGKFCCSVLVYPEKPF